MKEDFNKVFLEIFRSQLNLVSSFGNHILLISLTIICFLIILIYQKHFGSALTLILTTFSYPISLVLKGLFRHERPQNASYILFLNADKYSFPSSHVIFYTVFWGYIFYLTFKFVKDAKLLTHTIRYLALYFILLVGASRVFLGVHYIKDIVFGYIIGFILLILIIFLDKKLNKIFTKDQK